MDDIPVVEAELRGECSPKHTFSVPAVECKNSGIYVPRYYWHQRDEEIEQIALAEGYELISMADLIDAKAVSHFDGHGSPKAENKGNGDVPYIRVKDIVNWEVYKDPTAKIPRSVYEAMTTKIRRVRDVDGQLNNVDSYPKALCARDLLYVKRGSYRIGSVAFVSPYDTEVLLTREILVLRVASENRFGLTPEYLLYALSHRLVQMQTMNKVLIETTLPNIGDRWKQLRIPIPKDQLVLKSISDRIAGIVASKWNAVEEIAKLREELGNLTT